MKDHRCTRFKQTGSMQLVAANISVTRDGERRSQLVTADTVQLECIRCGKAEWVERSRVQDNGKYLALTPEEAP